MIYFLVSERPKTGEYTIIDVRLALLRKLVIEETCVFSAIQNK